MATKNNLDVGGEAPHHTELAERYRIGDSVYDLSQVIAAVKGDQGDDEWNGETMGSRLDRIKEYVKTVDAEKVEADENTAQDDAGQLDVNGNGQDATDSQGAEAAGMFKAASRVSGPVDTLRAFKQDDEADEVEKLIEERDGLRKQLEDIRAELSLGEDDDITTRLQDWKQDMAEASSRVEAAENARNELAKRVRQLEDRATRGPALHGSVDELKAPY